MCSPVGQGDVRKDIKCQTAQIFQRRATKYYLPFVLSSSSPCWPEHVYGNWTLSWPWECRPSLLCTFEHQVIRTWVPEDFLEQRPHNKARFAKLKTFIRKKKQTSTFQDTVICSAKVLCYYVTNLILNDKY